MAHRRGQAALEYFLMIAIALLISSPIILQAQGALQQLRDTNQIGRLSDSMDAIQQAASLVDSQGSPAKASFTIALPDGINEANISDDYIYYQMRIPEGNTTFYRSLDFQVRGKLPTAEGVYQMVAQAEESYVNITQR